MKVCQCNNISNSLFGNEEDQKESVLVQLLNIITKNKDINNITILMNIIYEASILLLTIPGEMLSMQKCCCYDTKYKNTCFVCILKL